MIAVSVLLVRMRALPTLGGVPLSMDALMEDFKLVSYCPAHILLHGGNPYDPAQFQAVCPSDEGMPLYLPSTFLIHAPFGLLPLGLSVAAYFIVTVVLTIGLAAAAYRLSGLRAKFANVLLVGALLLLSRPGQWNALLGQPAVELALGSYVALHYARRRPWLSGMGLALAVYKPTFGAPLMALMLARGDRAAVGAGALITGLVNLPLLALLAYRSGGVRGFVDGLLAGQREWEAAIDPTQTGWSVDFGAFVGRFLGHPFTAGAQVLLALVVLGGTAVVLRRLQPTADPAKARLSASLICLATLVGVHHQAYDLVLLAAPLVVLASHALPVGLVQRRWELVLYALYGVLALNYLGTLGVLSRLEDQPVLWVAIASLNGAALLAIYLIYVGLTTRFVGGRIAAGAVRPA